MMEKILAGGERYGTVSAPPSKSMAHRFLICAALSKKKTEIEIGEISRDIAATVDCLRALCADIAYDGQTITVNPHSVQEGVPVLQCGESGSTLRFLIPVCGALGVSAVFQPEGSLTSRTISPLSELLKKKGMIIEKNGDCIKVGGKIECGDYEIAGDVSSQFISGLLFALSILGGKSGVIVTGKFESQKYVDMTVFALEKSGIQIKRENHIFIIEGGHYDLDGKIKIEGDYSNAAAFLCMGALSNNGITVKNLNPDSLQGDKKIVDILKEIGAEVMVCGNAVTVKKKRIQPIVFDASATPDLVPCVAALLCFADGKSEITGGVRLRLKESDRIQSTVSLIRSAGGSATETLEGMIINGTGTVKGGDIQTFSDHRIAMAATILSAGATDEITVDNPLCVSKSYRSFFDDFESLKVLK